MPSCSVITTPKVRYTMIALTMFVASLLEGALPASASAIPAAIQTPKQMTIPPLPYPQSTLRQRLIAQGKSLPPIDQDLQSEIPAQYHLAHPIEDQSTDKRPAVIALPDCDDTFPNEWIKTLQSQGISVLVISPMHAHPSQPYCSKGSLENPKHGLTYWAFDAISALAYLTQLNGIDPERIAVFGYGYGAGAAQLAIYRKGHAKHFDHRFKALIGLRPQCMSEMDNFVASLLIGVEGDRFNPPAWCQWRMDRDLGLDRASVRFELIENGEITEKQATRKPLAIESSPPVVELVTDFLSEAGMIDHMAQN